MTILNKSSVNNWSFIQFLNYYYGHIFFYTAYVNNDILLIYYKVSFLITMKIRHNSDVLVIHWDD